MSRLDSHIRQKIAQRDTLNLAAERLGRRGGDIVEFGLGHGRSYSHLAERFPEHAVYCFDRRDVTPPGWGPPPERLVLGELGEVLGDPAVHARFAGRVILAHMDLASGPDDDARLHHFVVGRVVAWLAPGGWLLSDRALTLDPAWRLEPVDTAVRVQHPDRYYAYEHRVT